VMRKVEIRILSLPHHPVLIPRSDVSKWFGNQCIGVVKINDFFAQHGLGFIAIGDHCMSSRDNRTSIRFKSHASLSAIEFKNLRSVIYSAWPRMMPCREFGFESYFGLNFYSSVG